jgi:hypothetical protein
VPGTKEVPEITVGPEEGEEFPLEAAVRKREGFCEESETATMVGWGERTGGPGVGGRERRTCCGEGGGAEAAGDLAWYCSGPAGDLMARWLAGEEGGGPAGDEGTENWYWAAATGEGAGEWLGGR